MCAEKLDSLSRVEIHICHAGPFFDIETLGDTMPNLETRLEKVGG